MTSASNVNNDDNSPPEPYAIGTEVEITIPGVDIDSRFDGVECEITGRTTDDLHKLTLNERDKYHYDVQQLETGESLPLSFRHDDLTPLTK